MLSYIRTPEEMKQAVPDFNPDKWVVYEEVNGKRANRWVKVFANDSEKPFFVLSRK